MTRPWLWLTDLGVDPDSADYRAGFCLSFPAPRSAVCPPGSSHAFRVGFRHGRHTNQVPEELLEVSRGS